jgi:hypothetical protein
VIAERFLNPEHRAMWRLIEQPEQAFEAIGSTPRWHRNAREFAAVR